MKDFRPLTDEEVRLIETVLPLGVDGREQYLNEAKTGLVEIVNDDDSLFFKVPQSDEPAFHSVVSEAEYVDIDGVTTHLTVHVVHGKLHEVEIYKEDGSGLRAPIQRNKIHLVWSRQNE